jgi:chorismate mutase
MQNSELALLREEIDKIDEELVELLSRRFRATERIGTVKAIHGFPAVDAEREAKQEQRLSQLAGRHGVNPKLVSNVFRTIVTEVVSNHITISQQQRN